MHKGDLIEQIAQAAEIDQTEARRALNLILSGITDELRREGQVVLPGFGIFRMAKRRARVGSNPQTHEKMEIPARKTVRFSAGNRLKSLINSKG